MDQAAAEAARLEKVIGRKMVLQVIAGGTDDKVPTGSIGLLFEGSETTPNMIIFSVGGGEPVGYWIKVTQNGESLDSV